jgi:hypothetical protein
VGFAKRRVACCGSPNSSYYETEDGPVVPGEEKETDRRGFLRTLVPRFENKKEPFAFFGAIFLNVLLGTVYCWSCYLVPLEHALGVGRGVLSWVFSVTTVAFTISVAKLSPHCSSKMKPAWIASAAAFFGGLGMLIAAQAVPTHSVVPLFIGYGVFFGGAAGVGYGLSTQISTASNPPFGEGLSVGMVTSARAAGAFLFAPGVRYLLDVGDVSSAMTTMGALLCFFSVPLYIVLNRGGLDEPLADPKRDPEDELNVEEVKREETLRPALITLWAVLGLGVSSGLMVISHAAVLLYSHGASVRTATAGVSIVSACTSLGRLFGGWACDRERCGPAKVLRCAPLLAAPALAWASAASASVTAAQCALALASLTYGALGTAVPTEVRRRVGARKFARAYGNVYTAWGVAGVLAPAAAGVLYDAAGNYVAALAYATGLCLAAAAAAAMLRPGRSHEEWEETMKSADAKTA